MPEREALVFLDERGLTVREPGAGSTFGWGWYYPLEDGYTLALTVIAQPPKSGEWANGRLKAAEIRRHGDVVVKIKLRNAA